MDRSFLSESASEKAAELAIAVVALGESLNLDVVAEGIEMPEQWDALRDLGCALGQGFYFARPMTVDATAGLPAHRRRRHGARRRCCIAATRGPTAPAG